MRIAGRGYVGTLTVAAVLVLGTSAIRADDLQWLGAHGAYYSKYRQGAFGLNARQDVGASWSVGFMVDYVIRPHLHRTWAGTVDLQWETPLPDRHLLGWIGAGGGVLRDQPHGMKEDYFPFASGFIGVGLNGHPVMPYVEMRIMSEQVFHGVVYAGLRF